MELLEHEADGFAAEAGPFGIGQLGGVGPSHPDDPAGREVQDAQQAEHGGLPGSGWPDDGQKLPGPDVQRDIVEGADLDLLAVDP